MDNLSNQIKPIRIYECGNKYNEEIISKEISFEFTQENLKIPTIINLINEYFNVNSKKLSLFDWKGVEITEDADLWKLVDDCAYNRVVFFLRKGETFDNKNILKLFKLGQSLGEGGFGKVFLATFADTEETFAIKFLTHVNDVDYLFKEINVLTRLEHENIIKLYSYCATEENKIALIMEYGAGGTLSSYIKNKIKLDENEARIIFKQILETVKYCHNQEIIHRDLKPDNILFHDNTHTQIKIIDFGIATLLHDKTRAGSLNYISPEVLSGKDSSSLPSVDIWSIGCILYEMLTGKKMFKGKNNNETKENLLERKVKFPLYLSLEVVDLIDSLCKYHPRERISIDSALSHPWMKNEVITNGKIIQNCKNLYAKNSNNPKHLTLSLSGQIRYTSGIKELSASKKIKNCLTNRKYLITKIPSEISDDNFFNYNLSVMRKFNGNMPSYMAPIGHNKNQKHTASQFKEYFNSLNIHPTQSTNPVNTNGNSTNNPGGSRSYRNTHYYINTNGNEINPTKKKSIELPPLSSSKKKHQVSVDKFNISHNSGKITQKTPTSKNYNGKKITVLKINL